ncbi:SDR family NAD(P)-dependent oxidoreductase [Agaribacterium haliotis]|uniref:SDR family NAD(P)-dependent oxidoreductase n=1 Tax=Agaribacterium haliotis TaxID=2013869 RepID=UPI0013040544|nr:SDR family NAD(P)-dependent oxidoreductase [Agaribacterium haliotis]
MSKKNEKYGNWAMVTGASSGIGLAFCKQLAEKGYNLVMVARSVEKMEKEASELMGKYKVDTKVIGVDLSDAKALSPLEHVFTQLNIALLVNNAGWGQPGVFKKHTLDNCLRETQLNINTPLTLTKWFIDNNSERKGLIFLSSIAAYMGSPYLANYSACKAWTLNFGVSLYHELKEEGSDVLVLAPGPTKTGMFGIDNIDFSKIPMHWMKAEDVAKLAIKNLGKKPVTVPGLINKIMKFMMAKIMPRSFAQKMFGSMMKPAMPNSIL